MLRATISADVLGELIASTTVISDDVLLSIKLDGLEIRTTDRARVARVDVSLPSTAFESYEATLMQTALNLDHVDEFLDLVDGSHPITICIDNYEKTIQFQGNQLSYRSSLLDSTDVPSVFHTFDPEQSAEILLSGEELNLPLNLSDMAASRVEVSVDSDQNLVSGLADDLRDSVYFELPSEDVSWICPANVKSQFSLDYLAEIQRTIPDDVTVQLVLGDDESITLQYPIADGEGDVMFTLAPSL